MNGCVLCCAELSCKLGLWLMRPRGCSEWVCVVLNLACTSMQKERKKVEENVLHHSQHVDDPSIFADGFPFLLKTSFDLDHAGLQDHFLALGVEEDAQLVRAGWFGGVVGLLPSFVLVSMEAFFKVGEGGWGDGGTIPTWFGKGPFRRLCLRRSCCGRSRGCISRRRSRPCWCTGLGRRRCAPFR